MSTTSNLHLVPQPVKARRWWQSGWFKAALVATACVFVVLAVVAEYLLHHAEPIIRKRVIASLSERFHAPVQLDHLDISLVKGVAIEGFGLKIPLSPAAQAEDNQPPRTLISVDRFSFRTSLQGLLHQPTEIGLVRADGVHLDIPPGPDRKNMTQGEKPKHKMIFSVQEVLATNVTLSIESSKPGKEPLEFDIATLKLDDVHQLNNSMRYDAQLTNPKPIGQIHAQGHFGPWFADEPRAVPIDGAYSFDHADLSTIKGISGILSSVGHYNGVLDNITVDGTTETPDFALDLSNHPVPLHTTFHAYVDGTSGDTTLDPVQAVMGHTPFTCRGTIMHAPHQGHDIALTVDMPNGRMEDLLVLGMKSPKPAMLAGVTMKAKLHIPPGPERVTQKIQLAGTLTARNIEFTNPQLQDHLDGLSMRAQGKPQDVKQASSDRTAEVSSQLTTAFSLAGGMAQFSGIRYTLPGAKILLNGAYTLPTNQFIFKGHVRTDATASQMTTGWKSFLLKAVDPFLKKDGAGVQLPIEISGTKDDLHFGLAMHGTADETAAQMAGELRGQHLATAGKTK